MHISHLTFRAATESCFLVGEGWLQFMTSWGFLPYTAKKDKAAYFLLFIELLNPYVFCTEDKTLTLGTKNALSPPTAMSLEYLLHLLHCTMVYTLTCAYKQAQRVLK